MFQVNLVTTRNIKVNYNMEGNNKPNVASTSVPPTQLQQSKQVAPKLMFFQLPADRVSLFNIYN